MQMLLWLWLEMQGGIAANVFGHEAPVSFLCWCCEQSSLPGMNKRQGMRDE